MDRPLLLAVDDLRVQFDNPRGVVRAVDGLSFELGAGEALGLVGESGCGKTVTSLALLHLQAPGRITGGRILWEGDDLVPSGEAGARAVRGHQIGMVFQDPVSSLDPVMSVGAQLAETFAQLRGVDRRESRRLAVDAMAQVGLPDSQERARDYPHQLSGGQCQRVMIAAALAGEPRLLLADEPTTALDATTQARVLDLLGRLRRERDLALLLVSHDLDVVAHLTDRVLIMYAGRAAEVAPTARIFGDARHPYTRGLLACRPSLTGERRDRLTALPGSVRDLPEGGCAFSPRCDHADDRCRAEVPSLRTARGDHTVACHHFEELGP